MLQIFKKNRQGFTLIELLVVIAIIGILASIVLVSMGTARASARDSARKADMRQIVSAQQLYYNANDKFFTCDGLSPTVAGDCGAGDTDGWPNFIGTFMPKTPMDPGSKTYYWVNNTAVGDDQKFCAWVELEGGTWYTSTHAGNVENATAPTDLADCIDGD